MAANLIHEQLQIGGMTCVRCQDKIEKALRGVPGVRKASVRYDTGTADITYDADAISTADITNVIEKLDYRVLKASRRPDISRVISMLAIIVCLFILLQRSGILNLLAPSQLADTAMGYGTLFILGLITSVHCIAMCGGINLSQCLPQKTDSGGRQKGRAAILPAVLYNLGRVVSYTAIGFLLGLVGLLAGGSFDAGLSALLQGILKLAAGVFMVIMGLNMLDLFPWLRRLSLRPPRFLAAKVERQRANSKRPLVVGLLNGLMPCGPLQSMQIVALASGSPFAGALSMLLFSLGTVPLMLGLGSIVSLLGKKFTRGVMTVGAVLVTVLGLAMLSQGGSLSGLLPPERLLALVIFLCAVGIAASLPFPKGVHRGAALAVTVCAGVFLLILFWPYGGSSAEAGDTNTSSVADGVQVVTSTLSPGSYPDITVQAGVPVRWIIDAPAGSINGCNYKMILQEYGIEHTFQEGENIIEFTPAEAGAYQYSCWMGMIHGSIFVTAAESGGADPPALAVPRILPTTELSASRCRRALITMDESRAGNTYS